MLSHYPSAPEGIETVKHRLQRRPSLGLMRYLALSALESEALLTDCMNSPPSERKPGAKLYLTARN